MGRHGDPDRARILAWLAEDDNRSPVDAIHRFYPLADPDLSVAETRRIYNRIYTWTRRAKSPVAAKASKPRQKPRLVKAPGVVHSDYALSLATPDDNRVVMLPNQNAAQAIGTLTPGVRICGLTKGQFSILDLLRAVLEQIGPADVVVCTWSAGLRDAETMAWLLREKKIRSFGFLMGRAFESTQRRYAQRIVDLFGESAIVTAKVHAKFALIRNDDWAIVIRGSMNLNRNPRYEQFDLDDNVELHDFFKRFHHECVANTPKGLRPPWKAVDHQLEVTLGGGQDRDAFAGQSKVIDLPEHKPETSEVLASPEAVARKRVADLTEDLRICRDENKRSLVPKLDVQLRQAYVDLFEAVGESDETGTGTRDEIIARILEKVGAA